MKLLPMRRLRLFIRDSLDEFGVAWAVARTRDCERNGGHQWEGVAFDTTFRDWGTTCSRCGTWQSMPSMPSTFGAGTTAIWVLPNVTTGTGNL